MKKTTSNELLKKQPLMSEKLLHPLKSKMLAAFLTTVIFLHLQPAFSQTQFQTVFSQPSQNLISQSVQEDVDGGYITTAINANSGTTGSTVIKTDAAGVIVWNKTFTGYMYKIIPVSTGGYIMVGYHMVPLTFGGSGLIYKLDANGKVTWSKSFTSTYGVFFRDIIETIDGSNQAFAITGYETRQLISGSALATDMLAMKISNTGSILWVHSYGRNTNSVYNNLFEYGRTIHEVVSSNPSYPNYVITGQCNGYNTSHTEELYVVKVNGSNGSKLFDYIYIPYYPNGDPLHQDYHSWGISSIDSNENLLVLAQGTSSGNITKLDNTGAILWCKNYSGSGFSPATSGIDCNSSGYIASSYPASLLKITTSGSVSWGKSYSGDDVIVVDATSDGGYVAATGITVSDESNNEGCLLIKTNSSGQSNCYESSASFGASDNPINAVALSGDDTDVSAEITSSTGSTESAVCLNTYARNCSTDHDFDYVSGAPVSFTVSEAKVATKTLYYINEADETWPSLYTIKWTLIESVSGSTVYTDVTDHSDDDANTYYSTLRTNSGFQHFIDPTVRTDKSLCVDVTFAGCRNRECFGASPVIGGSNFREAGTQTETSLEDISDITVFPNPASTNVTVLIPNGESSVIEIVDLSGRKIKSFSTNQIENKLYIGDIATGLYLLNVYQTNGSTSNKLQIK